jgi:hypothetical protein
VGTQSAIGLRVFVEQLRALGLVRRPHLEPLSLRCARLLPALPRRATAAGPASQSLLARHAVRLLP